MAGLKGRLGAVRTASLLVLLALVGTASAQEGGGTADAATGKLQSSTQFLYFLRFSRDPPSISVTTKYAKQHAIFFYRNRNNAVLASYFP